MLDWRGLVGTAAVHAAAMFAPQVPLPGVTVCLCDVPNQPEPVTLPVGRPVTFAIMNAPTLGRDVGGASLRLSGARCGDSTRRVDRPPVLLAKLPLPARRADPTGSGLGASFCVMVDGDGAVTRVRLLSGEAALAGYARRLRFTPATTGGEAVSAEVELGLTWRPESA